MAKRRITLRHRGYLYAQGHMTPLSLAIDPKEITSRRMKIAEDWRAGYLAAQRDARGRKT